MKIKLTHAVYILFSAVTARVPSIPANTKKSFGLSTLPGKMLDLGLFKINFEGVFPIFSSCGGLSFNPAGSYHNPFS